MVTSSHGDCQFLSILGRQGVELSLEGFDWVFFDDVSIGVTLIVIKVDQIGCLVVLVVWVAFWAVSGEVSYFSTLKTCI